MQIAKKAQEPIILHPCTIDANDVKRLLDHIIEDTIIQDHDMIRITVKTQHADVYFESFDDFIKEDLQRHISRVSNFVSIDKRLVHITFTSRTTIFDVSRGEPEWEQRFLVYLKNFIYDRRPVAAFLYPAWATVALSPLWASLIAWAPGLTITYGWYYYSHLAIARLLFVGTLVTLTALLFLRVFVLVTIPVPLIFPSKGKDGAAATLWYTKAQVYLAVVSLVVTIVLGFLTLKQK